MLLEKQVSITNISDYLEDNHDPDCYKKHFLSLDATLDTRVFLNYPLPKLKSHEDVRQCERFLSAAIEEISDEFCVNKASIISDHHQNYIKAARLIKNVSFDTNYINLFNSFFTKDISRLITHQKAIYNLPATFSKRPDKDTFKMVHHDLASLVSHIRSEEDVPISIIKGAQQLCKLLADRYHAINQPSLKLCALDLGLHINEETESKAILVEDFNRQFETYSIDTPAILTSLESETAGFLSAPLLSSPEAHNALHTLLKKELAIVLKSPAKNGHDASTQRLELFFKLLLDHRAHFPDIVRSFVVSCINKIHRNATAARAILKEALLASSTGPKLFSIAKRFSEESDYTNAAHAFHKALLTEGAFDDASDEDITAFTLQFFEAVFNIDSETDCFESAFHTLSEAFHALLKPEHSRSKHHCCARVISLIRSQFSDQLPRIRESSLVKQWLFFNLSHHLSKHPHDDTTGPDDSLGSDLSTILSDSIRSLDSERTLASLEAIAAQNTLNKESTHTVFHHITGPLTEMLTSASARLNDANEDIDATIGLQIEILKRCLLLLSHLGKNTKETGHIKATFRATYTALFTTLFEHKNALSRRRKQVVHQFFQDFLSQISKLYDLDFDSLFLDAYYSVFLYRDTPSKLGQKAHVLSTLFKTSDKSLPKDLQPHYFTMCMRVYTLISTHRSDICDTIFYDFAAVLFKIKPENVTISFGIRIDAYMARVRSLPSDYSAQENPFKTLHKDVYGLGKDIESALAGPMAIDPLIVERFHKLCLKFSAAYSSAQAPEYGIHVLDMALSVSQAGDDQSTIKAALDSHLSSLSSDIFEVFSTLYPFIQSLLKTPGLIPTENPTSFIRSRAAQDLLRQKLALALQSTLQSETTSGAAASDDTSDNDAAELSYFRAFFQLLRPYAVVFRDIVSPLITTLAGHTYRLYHSRAEATVGFEASHDPDPTLLETIDQYLHSSERRRKALDHLCTQTIAWTAQDQLFGLACQLVDYGAYAQAALAFHNALSHGPNLDSLTAFDVGKFATPFFEGVAKWDPNSKAFQVAHHHIIEAMLILLSDPKMCATVAIFFNSIILPLKQIQHYSFLPIKRSLLRFIPAFYRQQNLPDIPGGFTNLASGSVKSMANFSKIPTASSVETTAEISENYFKELSTHLVWFFEQILGDGNAPSSYNQAREKIRFLYRFLSDTVSLSWMLPDSFRVSLSRAIELFIEQCIRNEGLAPIERDYLVSMGHFSRLLLILFDQEVQKSSISTHFSHLAMSNDNSASENPLLHHLKIVGSAANMHGDMKRIKTMVESISESLQVYFDPFLQASYLNTDYLAGRDLNAIHQECKAFIAEHMIHVFDGIPFHEIFQYRAFNYLYPVFMAFKRTVLSIFSDTSDEIVRIVSREPSRYDHNIPQVSSNRLLGTIHTVESIILAHSAQSIETMRSQTPDRTSHLTLHQAAHFGFLCNRNTLSELTWGLCRIASDQSASIGEGQYTISEIDDSTLARLFPFFTDENHTIFPYKPQDYATFDEGDYIGYSKSTLRPVKFTVHDGLMGAICRIAALRFGSESSLALNQFIWACLLYYFDQRGYVQTFPYYEEDGEFLTSQDKVIDAINAMTNELLNGRIQLRAPYAQCNRLTVKVTEDASEV